MPLVVAKLSECKLSLITN